MSKSLGNVVDPHDMIAKCVRRLPVSFVSTRRLHPCARTLPSLSTTRHQPTLNTHTPFPPPHQLRFPVDSFRYYLAKDPFGGDFNFNDEALLAAHNNELADVLVRARVGGVCCCICMSVHSYLMHESARAARHF
jgi:valyl-tRNA synthetase